MKRLKSFYVPPTCVWRHILTSCEGFLRLVLNEESDFVVQSSVSRRVYHVCVRLDRRTRLWDRVSRNRLHILHCSPGLGW